MLFGVVAAEMTMVGCFALVLEVTMVLVAGELILECAVFLATMAVTGLLHLVLFRTRRSASPSMQLTLFALLVPLTGVCWGSHITTRFPFTLPHAASSMFAIVTVSFTVQSFFLLFLSQHLARFFQPACPSKSKSRLIRRSRLPGVHKLHIMWRDEDAGLTRVSFVGVLLAWVFATVLCICIRRFGVRDHEALSLFVASCGALEIIVFVTYDLEKQLRLCEPYELLAALVNLHNDIFLTVFDTATCFQYALHGTDLGSALAAPSNRCKRGTVFRPKLTARDKEMSTVASPTLSEVTLVVHDDPLNPPNVI